jgi:uncharacterized membrane protein
MTVLAFSAHVGNEYNTLMVLAAATAFLLILDLGRRILQGRRIAPTGWVGAFVTLGAIMTFLGGVMTVTWPLKQVAPNCCQQDNIIFGEPVLGYGVTLLAAAYLLWRTARLRPVIRGGATSAAPVTADPAATVTAHPVEQESFALRLSAALQPLSWFVLALGLSLIAIAVAGVRFKLFAAPPTEPISGSVGNHPLVEAIFISTLYALMGIGAVLLPFFLRTLNRTLAKLIVVVWLIPGVSWLGFAALNYYTHVGSLVKHTGRF